MLLTLSEESTQISSKTKNPHISEVSLNRLTAGIRKICKGLSFDASVTCNKHSSRGENTAPDLNVDLNSTMTFEFWEKICYEMSPTKRPIYSELRTREDLMKKSDQLMASLEKSIRETDSDGKYSCERNLSTTPKDCRDHINLTSQTSIETSSSLLANCNDKSNGVLVDPNNEQNYNKFQEICFEKARQAFEPKQSATRNKYRKLSDKISKHFKKIDSLEDCDDNGIFLSKFLTSICD